MPVGELSADAVPMLSAADSPLLILEARPQPNPLSAFPLRRKASFPAGNSAPEAPARRRGASVPPPASSPPSASSLACSSVSDPPTARGRPQPVPMGPPTASMATSSRRRGFTLSRKFISSRRDAEGDPGPPRRRVTFHTALHPDVAPCPSLLSYDELLFNVAGLYQTTDFLHYDEDQQAYKDQDNGGTYDDGGRSTEGSAPPLERSVPLMIAEFLFRSAVYLGYPTGDKPWIPGFRETKRFSSNDVRRWRRLAHFDWAKEEREFEAKRQAQHAKSKSKSKSRTRRRRRRDSASSDDGADAAAAGAYRVDGPALPSTDIALPSETEQPPRGRARLRAAVAKMMHRRGRRQAQEGEEGGDGAKAVDMERPPPVDPRLAASGELALLVTIVNSCVYCGAFRFRARDVVTLCNVNIDGF